MALCPGRLKLGEPLTGDGLKRVRRGDLGRSRDLLLLLARIDAIGEEAPCVELAIARLGKSDLQVHLQRQLLFFSHEPIFQAPKPGAVSLDL